MFSGIIKTLAQVQEIQWVLPSSTSVLAACSAGTEKPQTHPRGFWLSVSPQHLEGIELGASCAVNGVCLTVAQMRTGDHPGVRFDLATETLSRTNLASISPGDRVHFERSLRVGDEQGGHFLSGHIDELATLVALGPGKTGDLCLTFRAHPSIAEYLFDRGYLGVHGVSLTPFNCERTSGQFQVNLIAETMQRTVLSQLNIGDQVNIEIDQTTKVMVEVLRGVMMDHKASVTQ